MQGAGVLGRKFQVGPPLVGYSTGQLPEPRGPEAFLFPPPVVRGSTRQRAAPALTLAGLSSAFEFRAAGPNRTSGIELVESN